MKGSPLQAASIAAMMRTEAARRARGEGRLDTKVWRLRPIMWWILLEALGALALLLFLVWWTMFSGRRGGEPVQSVSQDEEDDEGGHKNRPG